MTARPFTRGWNAWTAKAAGPKDNQFPAGSDDAAEWERGRLAAMAAQEADWETEAAEADEDAEAIAADEEVDPDD